MKVKELMSKNVVYLRPEDSVSEAAGLLARHHIGMLPVCSPSGHVRGVVTDRDIVLRCIACEGIPEETTLREVMTRGIVSVPADADVREAIENMAAEQVRRLPVTDCGKLVGIISLSDLARCSKYNIEAAKALGQISSD